MLLRFCAGVNPEGRDIAVSPTAMPGLPLKFIVVSTLT